MNDIIADRPWPSLHIYEMLPVNVSVTLTYELYLFLFATPCLNMPKIKYERLLQKSSMNEWLDWSVSCQTGFYAWNGVLKWYCVTLEVRSRVYARQINLLCLTLLHKLISKFILEWRKYVINDIKQTDRCKDTLYTSLSGHKKTCFIMG